MKEIESIENEDLRKAIQLNFDQHLMYNGIDFCETSAWAGVSDYKFMYYK